ncbi:MAG: FAD:protein FMN transferase [Sedimentitalea sp.]|uniref:FAD:protein FMN transferase n=1 Tax=Sedimentitalea sp. TaxID=2048915 RepID=UPI0032676A5C
MINRRRFLTISAAALAFPYESVAEPLYTWRGIALGARATLRLAHPDAKAISKRIAVEISRLEDIFSLYRPNSSLMQLNGAGRLDFPPFELLECLSIAGAVHRVSEGRFDPTIQPLWACYAEASALGMLPEKSEINRAYLKTGWERVRIGTSAIILDPEMALTLNGIAQGYIADRVAEMLMDEGLTNVLIDTGEFRALGIHPSGRAWPVTLAAGGEVTLDARALATSAPLGTTFDEHARVGHIIDPRTGQPTQSNWREISVSATSAAVADALSTAACLLETRGEIDTFVVQFQGAQVEDATAA